MVCATASPRSRPTCLVTQPAPPLTCIHSMSCSAGFVVFFFFLGIGFFSSTVHCRAPPRLLSKIVAHPACAEEQVVLLAECLDTPATDG